MAFKQTYIEVYSLYKDKNKYNGRSTNQNQIYRVLSFFAYEL